MSQGRAHNTAAHARPEKGSLRPRPPPPSSTVRFAPVPASNLPSPPADLALPALSLNTSNMARLRQAPHVPARRSRVHRGNNLVESVVGGFALLPESVCGCLASTAPTREPTCGVGTGWRHGFIGATRARFGAQSRSCARAARAASRTSSPAEVRTRPPPRRNAVARSRKRVTLRSEPLVSALRRCLRRRRRVA